MKITEIKTKLVVMLLFAAAFSFEAADIKTVDGGVYNDVRIIQISKKGLVFRHKHGIVTLAPEKLSPADQNTYSSQIARYEALKKKYNAKPQPGKNSPRPQPGKNSPQSEQARKEIDAAVKEYEAKRPESFNTLEKAIRKYDGTPEAENGKKLLAEWKKKKQTELIVHHPGGQAQCLFYVFKCLPDLETTLKDIAEIHWKINDMNDAYMGCKAQAQMEIRMGNPNRADEALKRARTILQRSQQARAQNNQMFEKLLSLGYVVDKTDFTSPGMWANGVSGEFIFFIVEVVEGGKYVRAWCCRARSGSDLYIKGRKIECRYGDQIQGGVDSGPDRKDTAASGPGESPEHFDLVWMQKNKGYLDETAQNLRSKGFEHIVRHDIYRKEPFPPAALINCFMEDGHVKRSVIRLSSYSDPQAATDRFTEYTANLEKQLQGREVKSQTFTTESNTNNKSIKIYDLPDCHFMVAVYRMELPVINKYIIFVAAFSKKYYDSFESVVNELNG